jgi:hypothetical protein
MSGYFSRLIQQTGIALAIGKVSDAGNLQEAIAPHFGSEIVQIQSEENQEIGKQETQEEELKLRYSTIVKNGQDARSTKSEFLGGVGILPALVESQFLTRQADENPLSQVEIESSSPCLEAQKTIIKEQEVESLSAQVMSSQNAIAAEKSPELPKSYHQTEFDRSLESRTNNGLVKQSRSPETSSSEHLQKPDSFAESPSTKRTLRDREINEIPKEHNLPPTRQINLQTVREWVAETPEKNPNAQFPMLDAQFPISNSQFPNYPVQKNQNFVLSIGTINLTVEAPQSEVKKTPLPPIKSKQEVKPVSQTSRLSRHYIR